VAGVPVEYGRSENVIDDGVDAVDEGDEMGVPIGDPSGVKTAG
jgi:hypothetical protein